MLQKSLFSEGRVPEPKDVPSAPTDERVRGAWHAWLSALATDAEAALAAALAYEALDDVGRALWLDALDQDAPELEVPKLALYAPLLSVETEPRRRARIQAAVGDSGTEAPRPAGRALRGIATDGDRIVAVVLPLYLDFVHVVACRIRVQDGFVWVRRDPIVRDRDAPRMRSEIEGTVVEQTPLKPVVEELAHAVLAHRRSGREFPEALRMFVDLFQPGFGDD
ncbi:MAG TPA: hypothetical protein VJT73_16805 [Polyangiaceae bacterium]|nr:hypothetical protein [Polyangiaceae bacterium]